MTETRRAQDSKLSAAVQLGWRVAELYSLSDDLSEPSDDDLLPAHSSLQAADQLELQLRAAAGDAQRAGVTSQAASLVDEDIKRLAREAPNSDAARDRFRQRLRCGHIEIAKDLWALDEAAGNAYELGNGLSDTYGLVCRGYRVKGPNRDPCKAWLRVFERQRIERLKTLLDDLQTRLNPSGVTIVRKQLDDWCEQVPLRLASVGVPDEQVVRTGLRRQTIIWRQLIAGDKEPEAYLNREARVQLRDELRALVWKRSWRWIAPLAAVLLVLVAAGPWLVEFYDAGLVETGVVSAVVALAGAVGITTASVRLAVRSQLGLWATLLWNRSVAYKVAEKTLTLGEVLPPASNAAPEPLRYIGRGIGDGVRRSSVFRRWTAHS